MREVEAHVRASREQLAGDVARRMMHVASAMRHVMDLELSALGLTPATARALHQLDPDRPIPARDLAAQLGCDKSNMVALVDKLEDSDLVERRIDPSDRRVKILVITPAGRRMRARVHRVLSDGRIFAGLDDTELATLGGLMTKVSDGGCPEGCGEQPQ